jgi:spermidine/putrescine transport system permease protein
LPLWIVGASRIGVPPQVNVMGTLLFMVGVLYAIAAVIAGRRKDAHEMPPPVLSKG